MNSRQFLAKSLLKYPILVCLTILMGFSGALFNGVSTVLIVPILLELLGQSSTLVDQLPGALRQFLELFDRFPPGQRLAAMTVAVVFMIVLKNAATYAGSLASSSLNRKLAAGFRLDGLRILLDVDLSYYTRTRAGDLINCLNTEVSRTTVAVRTLARLAIAIITLLVFVGILIWTSWQLTLIATVALGLVALINQTAIRQSKFFGKELSRLSRQYSTRIVEVLSGIRLVKATANEQQEYQTISRFIHEREVSEYRSQLLFAGIAPINEICSIIALISVAAIGRAAMGERLETFAPILLTYLVVLFRMLPFVGQLNAARSQLANALPSVTIVNEFLRRSDKPFMRSGDRQFSHLEQGIHFKNLRFSYPGSDQPVLRGIDLYLKKGTTLALVGASGAGKSTLADLLPRFYDPNSGCIEIDGVDLKQFDIKTFRRRLGIVSQDTFLFNASVRDNLIYGRPEATEAEIQDAMNRANASEFILALPNGLETLIGDRGVLLSGGQRQRLAIARALIQDPDILILDEATSALDTISERLVQKAIDELSRDRTTLVIAHRLSTVQNANQIAVLDRGKVVETGVHSELLIQEGPYAKLCAIQFSERMQEKKDDLENSELENNGVRNGNGADGARAVAEKTASTSSKLQSGLSEILDALSKLSAEDSNQQKREEIAASAYATTLDLLQSTDVAKAEEQNSSQAVLN